jgi:hypothetical protein
MVSRRSSLKGYEHEHEHAHEHEHEVMMMVEKKRGAATDGSVDVLNGYVYPPPKQDTVQTNHYNYNYR